MNIKKIFGSGRLGKLFGGSKAKSMATYEDNFLTVENLSLLRLVCQGLNRGNQQITINDAFNYYNNISVFFTSVDKIASEFSQIKPLVYDPGKKEFVKDSKALELLSFLNNPNPDITLLELFYEMSSFFLATGNLYILLTGDINRKPLEMEVLDPRLVSVEDSKEDNFPRAYKVSSANSSYTTFYRLELGTNKKFSRFRYVTKDSTKELWHTKDFNMQKNMLQGTPRINYIIYEALQHLEGSKHNLSLLVNGTRPDGLLLSKEILDDTQYERVVAQLKNQHIGSNNAGKLMFFQGGEFDFKALSQSMKDMDFKELKKIISIAIYNGFNIPLPLVDPDRMTLANYEKANEALYDNAVFPITKRLFQELTMLLIPRFDIVEQILFYDVSEIPALEERRNRNLKLMSETKAFTINELRAIKNMPPIDGGEDIYIPLNLIPLSSADGTSGEKYHNILAAYDPEKKAKKEDKG